MSEEKEETLYEEFEELCLHCSTSYTAKDVLVGSHPFQSGRTVYGCPNCSQIRDAIVLCEEPECSWYAARRSTEPPHRYYCPEHFPDDEEE